MRGGGFHVPLLAEPPDARLVRPDSLFELRLHPERLTGELAGSVDACWTP
jgi:hypothetical protein